MPRVNLIVFPMTSPDTIEVLLRASAKGRLSTYQEKSLANENRNIYNIM